MLHSLYGIGTDITVTTAAGPPPTPGSATSYAGAYSPGQQAQQADYPHAAPGLGDLHASSVQGRTGSGKTTLLQILGALDRPTVG